MNRSIAFIAGFCAVLTACATTAAQQSYKWTQFVRVEGQPEPVPLEWVSTPEGKFAHSIKIPNPVPKDSGYEPWMSSEAYFKHLCETEAGEFIFKTVENVEGFYFMRPPRRPTDYDLMDRYKLEAPEIERLFQAFIPRIEERAALFLGSSWVTGVPWEPYRFVEEPDPARPYGQDFLRAHSYKIKSSPMKVDRVTNLNSRYGLTWRGIRRAHDRELAIAGGEWVIIDLKTNEVLAVKRQYGRTGKIPNQQEKVWWLNAVGCPSANPPKTLVAVMFQISQFSARVIRPIPGEK